MCIYIYIHTKVIVRNRPPPPKKKKKRLTIFSAPLSHQGSISASNQLPNVGALIIRIGFAGILYYNCNKEPQNKIGNY